MRLWNEGKRFAVVPAGRRSGKTEIAKRKLVVSLCEKKDWQDPRYFAAAPTREQAKRIFWNDLKELTPREWISKIYESELCVKTRFGSELWVIGLDKPERIEGVPWDGGVLDEYANMKEPAWTENVRPALSDRRGWCWFIGVPEGLNHYKALADYAMSAVDPDWGLYGWHSSGILPSDEIEAAKRVLDAKTFRQEYEASFEGSSGSAYYAYDPARHEDPSIALRMDLKIALCCDFNVDTCVWEVVQTDGRSVWTVDEIALRNTNTAEMGKAFLQKYGGHKAGIVLYGDAAGMARSTAGKSDYAILYDLGLKAQRVRKSNPAVRDRVNGVNAMLENTRGEARLFHHPRCAYLRKDLETVEWRSGGSEIDKSNPERTHASDALGYFIECEFPLRIDRPDPGVRFYK
ncbi:MAG: hypothetical protein A2V21_310500 [Deltaproteobacteria bacterium GWC2_55_46]|nr:MAG: hypothetical protein A2Z79_04590 [Deltaproteobacteria bacterium GWA2_55_82]OGQ64198.1 MAG: hypothetical protein A3I81_10975 [Deltaproteobacteria bacterium RIFCSPLOWO2_02_FULL_55_12]OIJ74653.1 MAG: hypothetical protein A2V21_310500 [Deltaproteobacteria bacterium GWC2_55_46]